MRKDIANIFLYIALFIYPGGRTMLKALKQIQKENEANQKQ